MLISGVIGFVGVMLATAPFSGSWLSEISYRGLFLPFWLFTILAISGLIAAFIGISDSGHRQK